MSTAKPLTAISTYGITGSSTRVRISDWLSHLQINARLFGYTNAKDNSPRTIATHLPSAIAAETQLRRLRARRNAGTMVISRAASPFSNGRLEAGLLRSWEHSVYDFDDALFARASSPYSRIWSKQRVWTRSVKSADVVIAGSEYLAERASAISRRVVMIPSCVEPDQYTKKTSFALQRDYPLAVWIGSPATEHYLHRISPALLRVHKSHGLRLRVISVGSSPLGPLGAMVDRMPWSMATFHSLLADADFGIMPLPNTEFERGKCAYKLLQYGASALPVIGDPVGASRTALHRMNGIAAHPHDWDEPLHSMLEATSTERRAMGISGLQAVENHYSFHAWQTDWVSALALTGARPQS